MSYSSGEALILGLVQAMAQFDASNTSRGKWKPLNTGASDHYAILRPGPFETTYPAMGRGTCHMRWRTVVEVWQRWVDDGTTAVTLEELTEAVMAQIEKYPTLGDTGGTINYAAPAGGSEMTERWLGEGGPVWAVWEVFVDWQEERAISPA